MARFVLKLNPKLQKFVNEDNLFTTSMNQLAILEKFLPCHN
ncbi:hypothetical protein LEP1GSC036_4339 [Leptospira weilii str. 2006001853]|uniref:Uncharacterized protein n=4 Tax=Leptospira weilii TaxID=28184 RepID=A0A828Z0V3_9LEPT|nr:hypothetical protein LEP1GSC036_4339 [Leptospira weilii str. 2006001853]EMM72060.1 hypothetical protein LEP1GSC038_3887 [Leptospira weilii str. 2006001855]EMN46433.1 hypothetical protein LEP1GSC086_3169 [Leptospira weilii str. LNT 1234]EMN91164.1 hypothetical protein LEP1GSC108_1030 [Leptospira weilii str. UI 13098]EMY14254.1 hypothetical protein LEP1GSC043_1644 [Leptospira weilii str. Ecochallenge]